MKDIVMQNNITYNNTFQNDTKVRIAKQHNIQQCKIIQYTP